MDQSTKSDPQHEGRLIGVFDSGIGGLTVLTELNRLFPKDNFIYIGDTARLPYGTKSRETVIKYALSLTRAILPHDPDALVIACNTASTHAREAVEEVAGGIPVIGMIEPAAIAAKAATRTNRIAVMATAGTVASGAYTRALSALDPAVRVTEIPAQMLVALAEEGWTGFDDHIARACLDRYLAPVFDRADAPDTLILGCTHFPVLSEMITDLLGANVALVNSGAAAARSLAGCCMVGAEVKAPARDLDARTRFFATDDPARFARNATRFFGAPLDESKVELIDVTHYSEESARHAISRRQNPSGQSIESTAA